MSSLTDKIKDKVEHAVERVVDRVEDVAEAAVSEVQLMSGNEEAQEQAEAAAEGMDMSTDDEEARLHARAERIKAENKAKGLDADSACTRVQRAYRLLRYVYKNLGPAMFVDSLGNSSHGKIDFLEGGSLTPAPWIRVAPTTAPFRLVKLFDHYWNLKKPEVLITVTGGAQDFSLSSQLQTAFDKGLVSAATSANAWVITAGSDTGVMRLVGDAIAKQEVNLPVIGIFPWGVTNGRERLAGTVGKEASYAGSRANIDGAPLNASHTHFVLVDNGKEGRAAWGSEINLRAGVEAMVANTKNVPIVQLVVQGGPGTLATVEATALEGKPVVILANSGGAATAIHDYCVYGIHAVEKKFHKMEPRLAAIKTLNEVHGEKLITFYALDEHGGAKQDLSTSLLEAIVKMMNTQPIYGKLPENCAFKHPVFGRGKVLKVFGDGRQAISFGNNPFDLRLFTELSSHPAIGTTLDLAADDPAVLLAQELQLKMPTRVEAWEETLGYAEDEKHVGSLLSKALTLTVTWDRPEIARKCLGSIKGEADEVGRRPEVVHSLQRALELQRKNITQMLLTLPGIDTQHVNMGRLYMQPDEFKFLRNNRALQTRLQQYVRSAKPQKDLNTVDQHLAYYKDFKRAIVPFFSTISPILSKLLRQQTETQRHDIFFWLVCHSNEQLASTIWAECDLPIHMMLLAALITQHMAKIIGGVSQDQFNDRVARMTAWAKGAMDCAPDEVQAQAVLGMLVADRWTAIDIAMHSRAKLFLSQRHCVSLIDHWWRGGSPGSTVTLDPEFNWLTLTIQILFPFLHPDVRKPKTGKDEQVSKESNVYDALGLYLNISGAERMAMIQAMKEQDRTITDLPAGEAEQRYREAHKAAMSKVIDSQQKPGDKIKMRSPLASFYNVPAVRFLIRALVHGVVIALYLSLILLTFSDPHELDATKLDASVPWSSKLPLLSDGGWLEICWIVMEVAFFLDQRHQNLIMSGKVALHTGSRWFANMFDLLILVALGFRLAMEGRATDMDKAGTCCEQPCEQTCQPYVDGRLFYQIYQVIISIKFLEVALKTLTYLNNYEPLGVLIIMIAEMMQDASLFFILFTVVTAGFMVNGAGLQIAGLFGSARDSYDPFEAEGAFWAPLWIMFGDMRVLDYSWIASITEWIYAFICCVGMVNLLVAMFADTYLRIKSASKVEFIYLDCQRMFMYRDVVSSMPPVLNLPFLLWDVMARLRSRCIKQKHRHLKDLHHHQSSPDRRSSFHGGSEASVSVRPQSPSMAPTLVREGTLREGSVGSENDLVAAAAREKKDKKTNVLDGKIFVDAFLKQQEKLSADDPQSIAQAIHQGFGRSSKAQEEDGTLTKRMMSEMSIQLEELKKKLQEQSEAMEKRDQQIEQLIQGQQQSSRPARADVELASYVP